MHAGSDNFGAADATPGWLRAKLRRPLATQHFVRRDRLDVALTHATEAPVVLVTAPAGAGKTTLVAAWSDASPVRSAWLTLDRRDREPMQLAVSLVAVVGALEPECVAAGPITSPRSAPPALVVDALLSALHERDRPAAVIVIDDAHVLDGADDASELFAGLVLRLPPWLRVVIAARHQLDLPIDRLRARGQLVELSFEQLRFSEPESAELLEQLAPDAPPDWIRNVVERSQGWAAGLQLSALSWRSSQSSAAAPSPDDDIALIERYITNEVLATQPEDVVNALRDLSVVDRFNTGLAEAVTGRSDAPDLVASAEARGLFVFPRAGGFHEIHGIVRNVLLSQLGERSPDPATGAHARAARWYEQHDDAPSALEHWLLAQRFREALQLLSNRHLDLYDAGASHVVERVISTMPATVTATDFGATLEFAWCHLLVGDERFRRLVDRLTWWAERTPPEPMLRARLDLLRSVVAGSSGDWHAAGELATRGLASMGDQWQLDPLGRFGLGMVARSSAMTESWDDASSAIRDVHVSLALAPSRRLAFEGVRALGLALAGRPLQADTAIAGVRGAVDVSDMAMLRSELDLATALVNRELGDPERARGQFEELAAEPVAPMNQVRAIALVELAEIDLDRGDLDAASEGLRAAEIAVAVSYGGRDGRSLLGRTEALVSLALGNVAGASAAAEQIVDGFWRPVTEARVLLARDDRPGALEALERAVPRNPRHEVVRDLLRARSAPDPATAEQHALAAVAVAAEHGLLQTVASEGAEAVAFAERCAWRVPAGWIDRLRRATVRNGAIVSGASPGVEQLTDRERDVMRFLPSRLTLHEIAEELYISPNTLKFHLKVIYRKLGVSSRQEAIDVVRRMSTVRAR